MNSINRIKQRKIPVLLTIGWLVILILAGIFIYIASTRHVKHDKYLRASDATISSISKRKCESYEKQMLCDRAEMAVITYKIQNHKHEQSMTRTVKAGKYSPGQKLHNVYYLADNPDIAYIRD